jgi:N-acetyl sugar amidotransferase
MEIKPFNYQAGQVCTRCIMDDTVKGIAFDEEGVCTFCKIHDELEASFPMNEETPLKLQKLINKIKKEGRGKKYDCVLGVSGGRDSTYTLLSALKLGLRPLAVHFDNGWNTDLAVMNIKNVCKALDVDLYTHVADWEEFKDLQRSFLEASVPDAEVPTDWVIFSVLFKAAAAEKVKYIIHGHSFRTEGTTPLTWTYMDGRYVKDIHRRFGTKSIKSFPIMTLFTYLFYTFILKIRQIRLLYYLPYQEDEILDRLKNEVGWQSYGGKHHESKYTGFFQSYILTRKFNIDKRKLHYSALLRNNQMTREEALEKVKQDPYTGGEATMDYCLKKLEYSNEAFAELMNRPANSFLTYNSYYKLIKKFKPLIKWGTDIGIIPDTVYRKFFKFDI